MENQKQIQARKRQSGPGLQPEKNNSGSLPEFRPNGRFNQRRREVLIKFL